MSVEAINETNAADDPSRVIVVVSGDGSVWMSSDYGEDFNVDSEDVPALIEKLTKLRKEWEAGQ